MTRRAWVSPDAVGLPVGSNRGVEGLRRSEVATLAGVSVEYHSKLKRGAIAGASGAAQEAVPRALQLTDAEHSHLLDPGPPRPSLHGHSHPSPTPSRW